MVASTPALVSMSSRSPFCLIHQHLTTKKKKKKKPKWIKVVEKEKRCVASRVDRKVDRLFISRPPTSYHIRTQYVCVCVPSFKRIVDSRFLYVVSPFYRENITRKKKKKKKIAKKGGKIIIKKEKKKKLEKI